MIHYASWGIILDDIIYPDGRSAMQTLGGGGMYAACGMRVWHPEAAVCAAVGGDFETETLHRYGFDGSGIVVTDLPTPRAWQLLEEDGRRTQIPRVPAAAWFQQLVHIPMAQPIPASLKGLHFLGEGDAHEEEFVQALSAAGVILSAEPLLNAENTPEEIDTLKRCLPHFEIFSPDEFGLQVLVGDRPIGDQLAALAQMGPRLVALRRGKEGSIIYDRDSDRFWRVPAAPATVVDVTGAGNAFCGGLLVGWLESGNDSRRAAACASISAAFALEQVGPPIIDGDVMARAQVRAAEAELLITAVDRGEV